MIERPFYVSQLYIEQLDKLEKAYQNSSKPYLVQYINKQIRPLVLSAVQIRIMYLFVIEKLLPLLELLNETQLQTVDAELSTFTRKARDLASVKGYQVNEIEQEPCFIQLKIALENVQQIQNPEIQNPDSTGSCSIC